MKYVKDTFALIGDTVGVTTAAGYYEFVVTNIVRKQSTARAGTYCDYYMGDVTDSFRVRPNHTVYLNAIMLKNLKPINLTAERLDDYSIDYDYTTYL